MVKKLPYIFHLPSAVLLVSFSLLSGCSREEAPQQAPAPLSPAASVKDPALKAKFAERNAERRDLEKARSAVVAKMEAMIEAKKKELGTDDEAALKAALGKDPEWNTLYRRCEDANTALTENRRRKMADYRRAVEGQGRGKRE